MLRETPLARVRTGQEDAKEAISCQSHKPEHRETSPEKETAGKTQNEHSLSKRFERDKREREPPV